MTNIPPLRHMRTFNRPLGPRHAGPAAQPLSPVSAKHRPVHTWFFPPPQVLSARRAVLRLLRRVLPTTFRAMVPTMVPVCRPGRRPAVLMRRLIRPSLPYPACAPTPIPACSPPPAAVPTSQEHPSLAPLASDSPLTSTHLAHQSRRRACPRCWLSDRPPSCQSPAPDSPPSRRPGTSFVPQSIFACAAPAQQYNRAVRAPNPRTRAVRTFPWNPPADLDRKFFSRHHDACSHLCSQHNPPTREALSPAPLQQRHKAKVYRQRVR
ncbi:hypothetical protein BV25DRAFT_1532291 [Artomyces pyxidatus]|uniref:Uncharacterized protein n=1 Tax=Artomyces pyxidatus TaxID=48021 RepID=A0ACB8TD76_9AGAM|nr:hypothetical protein BV25DRAFT_1532291 [Artomyces pyxidatus]